MSRANCAIKVQTNRLCRNFQFRCDANRPAAGGGTVAEMESKANDLEKELARTVAGFGQALRQVTWQQVQAALKPNEAAIEFVHYRFYQKKQTDNTFYAALVLQPGADAPQFIPLIEEKQLTTLLQTEGKPKADFYNQLYAASAKGSQLYDLIWKPIAAALPASWLLQRHPYETQTRKRGNDSRRPRIKLSRRNST